MKDRVHLWVWGAVVGVGGGVAIDAARFAYDRRQFGADGWAYWLSGHRHELYSLGPRELGAFLYSPAFAQAVRPLTWLPWPFFISLWVVIEAAVFAWLLRPLGWRWGVAAFLWCVPELCLGNINGLLALTAAVGLTRPAAWAFPSLTKLAPAQGFLWFAVRREWRRLGVAAGATLAVASVSFVISPGWWIDWFRLLGDTPHHADVTIRLAVACAITVASVLTDRRWLIAVAVALATPVFTLIYSATILTAIPRLRSEPDATDNGPGAAPASGAVPIASQRARRALLSSLGR